MRPSRRPHTLPDAAAGASAGGSISFRSILAGSALCLTSTRVLFSSESAASHGDGGCIVLLWMAALLAWAVGVWLRRIPLRRCTAMDGCVLALAVWQALAGVAAMLHEAPRPAINMTWEWVGMLTGYWIWRSTAREPAEWRAACAVMVAMAVSLGVIALHQLLWDLPRVRAQYRQDPEAALEAAGVAAPPGSRQRALFEARLTSHEPTATFALTNSLAGFAVPWLVVAAGAWMHRSGTRVTRSTRASDDEPRRDARDSPVMPACTTRGGRAGAWQKLVWCLATLCLAGLLALTRSRAALLAGAFGLAAAWLSSRPTWRPRHTAAALLGIPLIVLAGAVAAQWAPGMFSNAARSFSYRLEYWQATWQLILQHPWLGCGPGNFQANYGRFMLPTSSETIADPHNFLFEVWATSGTPGAIAIVGVTAFFLATLPNLRSRAHAAGSGDSGHAPWMLLSGAAAYALVFLLGPAIEVPLAWTWFALGLASYSTVIWGLSRWVKAGELPLALLPIAGSALLLNLLAAGGIAYPSVAGSLWLLVASAVSAQQGNGADDELVPRPRFVVALPIVAAGLFAACYTTLFYPVISARTQIAVGREALRAGRIAEGEEAFARAAAADPWSSEPWKLLAAARFQVWERTRSEAAWDQFQHSLSAARRLDPKSVPLLRGAAEWYLRAFRADGNRASLEEALALQRMAVAVHPGHLHYVAELAWLLHLHGDSTAARREAQRALHFDSINEHADLALRGYRIYDPVLPPKNDAESLMRALASPAVVPP